MNIFEYKRRKDLDKYATQGRQTLPPAASGRSQPPVPPAASGRSQPPVPPTASGRPEPPVPPGPDQQQRRRRGRTVSRNADRWIYNQQLANYYQKVTNPSSQNQPTVPQRAGESQGELDERKEKYRKLLNDWFSGEVIREVFRRHPVHILYIGKPAWLMLPFTLVITVLAVFLPLLWFAVTPILIIQLALIAWFVNDWYNDFLIVTDRRVIQLEKISFLDVAKTEIPLDKVQEVKIAQRHGTLEYIFQVGTVTITSTGRTNIVFQRVYRPERIRREWDGLRKNYLMARTAFRKDRMRNYLENKIWGVPLVNWNADEEKRALRANNNPGWWQRVFPSGPIYEQDKKQLVWFTHPWILIKKEVPLIFGLVALLLFCAFGLPFIYRVGIGLLSVIITAAAFFGLLGIMFTIWYKYENWHNDRYVVGEEKIFDMIKLPLGFDETQAVIDIRNVQDVQSEKSGFVANILDYGTVKITTVGGPGIAFKNVPEPDLVEDEISRRKELLRFVDEERQDRLTADFFAAYRDILLHPEDYDQPDGQAGYGGPRGYR